MSGKLGGVGGGGSRASDEDGKTSVRVGESHTFPGLCGIISVVVIMGLRCLERELENGC